MGEALEGSPALPRVVLFDMDDTIFDHSLTCRDALVRLQGEEPILRRRSTDDLWAEYLRLLDSVQPAIALGTLTIDQARVERFVQLARFCRGSVPFETARAWSQRYRTHYQALRRLVPGARRLLERLHARTTIGIVTNNQVAEQEEKVAHFDLTGLVDLLVVSEGVGVSKPDPAIFSYALARAAAEPDEAVMVGDSWENDVVGALDAGISAIWFNRFHRPLPRPLRVPQLKSFRAPSRVESVIAASRRPR
jgi:HAD superfamily hydrolase (TIGR01549 family)